MPGSVRGETDDAGDVEFECDASGVAGVPGDEGGVTCRVGACGASGTDPLSRGGGRGMGFVGGDVVYGIVEGMGEGAGDGIAYVGCGPGLLKSRLTDFSNSASVVGSTVSCHSRELHISRSIWLISQRANMPWPTIDHDLLE